MAKEVEELQTERLILRGIREEDAPEIVRWRSDPEVYRFFKNPKKISIESHLNWFRTKYLQDENRYDWMCLEKETGKKIGVFGLIYNDEYVEVNYLLAPYAQHRGYATEILKYLIGYIKKQSITNIKAEIHKDNIPSIMLVKNLHFVPLSQSGVFFVYEFCIDEEKI